MRAHKTRMTLGVALVLALAPALAAHAEVTATVTGTTDYVWRGVSQTDEKPALQLGVEYEHESGLYAGTWGSNVDFDEDVSDPAHFEIDLYAGWRGETEGGLGWDIGVLRYLYPDTTEDFDYNGLVVSATYGIFTFEVDYSNDVFASGENGFYYNLGVSHEIPDLFTVAASVGYSDFDKEVNGEGAPDSYVDWRIGISRSLWDFDLDLSYYDTSDNGEELNGDMAEPRVVFTISRSLSF